MVWTSPRLRPLSPQVINAVNSGLSRETVSSEFCCQPSDGQLPRPPDKAWESPAQAQTAHTVAETGPREELRQRNGRGGEKQEEVAALGASTFPSGQKECAAPAGVGRWQRR